MSRPDREPSRAEPPQDADLALAILLEPLARGARILWVAEPNGGAERLATVATSIEAVGGPRRTRSAKPGAVKTRPWPGQGEAFDLVFAEGESDPARLLELARLVEVGGVLVVAVEARSTETYTQLHDSLARSFASVRMLGQARFSGFSHVDFARADGSEVAFDGSAVAGSERPLRWIAIAGSVDRNLEPYLVVQTSAEAPERVAPVAQEKVDRGATAQLERELEAARARLEHSEKRLEQAQREIARSGQKLDEVRHQLEQSQANLSRREAELASRPQTPAPKPNEAESSELRELESAYAELEERLHTQARELTSERGELARRATLVRDLVEELSTLRSRAPAPEPEKPPVQGLPELDRLRAQLVGVQRRLADAEGERASAVFRADELGAQLERARQSAELARPSDDAALAREREAARSALLERDAARSALLEGAKRHEEQQSATLLMRAELDGRLRGLRARVAEQEELRSLAEARLSLTEDDLRRARERMRTLEGEVEQSREQLAVARMRPPESSQSDGDAQREGALRGSLHQAREALAAAQGERDALLRELQKARSALLHAEQEANAAREAATQIVAQERSEVEVLRSTEAHSRASLVDLRDAHEARLAAIDSLEGERSGLRMRLADAEQALEAASAELEASAGDSAAARAERDALRAERDALAHERDVLNQLADEARVLREKIREAPMSDTLGEGEALDLAQQVAMLDAERAEARKIGILLGDVERDLEALRKERDAETARAQEAQAALASAGEGEAIKIAAWVQRVAARDALIARLQSSLTSTQATGAAHRAELAALEQRLMRAEEASTALEVARDVQRAEEQRERASLVDAAVSARAAADALADSHQSGLAMLSQTRGELATLLNHIKAPAPNAPEAVLRDEVAALQRELDDRGLMLRSLTAQLEEREERVRAFELGGASQAMKALEARLNEAEEKEARLVRELELAAERRTAAMEREAELRRLEQLLSDRDSVLMTTEGHLEQSQRAQAALRDQLARLGSELESVLGRVGSDSSSTTVERLGEILRALRK